MEQEIQFPSSLLPRARSLGARRGAATPLRTVAARRWSWTGGKGQGQESVRGGRRQNNFLCLSNLCLTNLFPMSLCLSVSQSLSDVRAEDKKNSLARRLSL